MRCAWNNMGGLCSFILFVIIIISACFKTCICKKENGPSSPIHPWTVCTSRQYCSHNATTEPSDKTMASCCQPCSCEESCYEFGNCCPDVQFKKHFTTKTTVPCVLRQHLLNPLTSDEPRDLNIAEYFRVQTSCPEDVMVSRETRKGCLDNKTLVSFTPVTSADGFRMYRNVHCAKCNGETVTVSWKLHAFCDVVTELFLTMYQLDEFILQYCDLNVLAPSPEARRKVTCMPNRAEVYSCNKTGKWNYYDKNIEDMCTYYYNQSYFNNMVYTGTFPFRKFPNPYCFLCNRPRQHDNTDSCPISTFQYSVSYRTFSGVLTLLIDMKNDRRLDSSVSSSDFNDVCPLTNSVYDRYTDRCRIVSCRRGQIFVEGACQAFGEIIGLCITLVYKLVKPVRVRCLEGECPVIHLLSDLKQTVEATTALGCDVKIMGLSIKVDFHNSNNTFFEIKISTVKSCPLYRFLDTFKERAHLSIEFDNVLDDHKQHYVLQLHLENYDGLGFIETGSESMSKCQSIILNMELLEPCPKITVSVNETLRYGNLERTVSVDFISKRLPGTPRGENFLICLQDYMTLAAEVFNASGYSMLYRECVLCIVLIVQVASAMLIS